MGSPGSGNELPDPGLMLDPHAVRGADQDLDQVDPAGTLAGEHAGRAPEPLQLVAREPEGRPEARTCAATLHFGQDQGVTLGEHEIDLTPGGEHAPGEHPVSRAPEVMRCDALPGPAEGGISGRREAQAQPRGDEGQPGPERGAD